MHYIPATPSKDDDDDTASKSSHRSRKSRGRRSRSRSKQRRKLKQVEATPPPNKAAHKQASKKLRGLIARTFASHKPKPTSISEQDALLTVIHCQDPENGGDAVSLYSNTSTSHSPWAKTRKSATNGNYGLQSTMMTPPPPPHPAATPRGGLYDDDEEYINPKERARRMEEAQHEIRSHMSFSMWQGIVAIIIYIVLSVICFSFFLEQDWTLIDSSYFAVVTFTTIGYGDVTPDTRNARMFTCVWALSGVACLGIALGALGSNLIVVHETHMTEAKGRRQSRVIGLFDHHKDAPSEENTLGSNGHSTIEEGKRRVMYDHIEDSDDEDNFRAQPKNRKSCWTICAPLIRWTLLTGYIVGILYWISEIEGWDLPKTVYYGIITASTVGYGDFSPKTSTGRLLAVFFIPVAVGIMGSFLEMVANAIIDHHREQYTKQLHNKPLTMEDIRILDQDGDGEVSRAEYLEFMLVAMNEVDKGLLDRLRENFHRLDVDGSGAITKADLAEMAKRRLAHEYLEERLRSAKQTRSNAPGTPTGMTLTGPARSSANIQKPSLGRRTTQQTSNRSSGTTPAGSSLSYQHRTNNSIV